MMEDDVLKCDGQWPKLIHVLAILIKFLKHELLLIITLRCLQDNLLGLGVKELLHLMIELLNSSSENGIYFVTNLFGISSNKYGLIWQFCTKLNNEWKACWRSSSSRQGQPLYWIALIAGSLCFLTQFMSSQGPQFFSCNFLNFDVEKYTFSLLDDTPKDSLIFELFWNSIVLKFSLTFLILLWFRVFCDINNFWVSELNFFYIVSKLLYYSFKIFLAWDVFCI